MTEATMVAQILITFGGLFMLGLLADLLGRHSPLPRVTVLLLTGFVIGPSVFDWLPPFTQDWFPVLTEIALAMIGFLLGHYMTRKHLKSLGQSMLVMSLTLVLATVVVVFVGLTLLGVRVEIALLLAGIAPATAPAACMDAVREAQAKGKFTDTLLGIVTIDDAWGLMAFSLLLAVVQALTGQDGGGEIVLSGAWEVVAALLLGIVVGLSDRPYSTRRADASRSARAGIVYRRCGAVWLGVSSILAAMALGATVANWAKHHLRPFRAIEGMEWPFLVLFFLLAGAALHVDELAQVGFISAAYIGLRVIGRIWGTRWGGRLSDADPTIRRWIGLALLPQAGVAIGMVLLACQRFPQFRDVLLPVVLSATVVFELVGPVLTRWVLTKVGDIRQRPGGPAS